jgi:hypothetical protein
MSTLFGAKFEVLIFTLHASDNKSAFLELVNFDRMIYRGSELEVWALTKKLTFINVETVENADK